MPWLELEPSSQYHVAFRYGSRKFKRSLKTKHKREAEQLLGRIERRLQLLESGDIEAPSNGDLLSFLLTNGQRQQTTKLTTARTLKSLIDAYRASLEEGPMEANSQSTAKTHLKHIQRILGARLDPTTISLDTLQKYVDVRKRDKGRRGRLLSPTTIRKEMTTFSGVWAWTSLRGLVQGNFPNRSLQYPKGDQKPPFATYDEITSTIETGHLSEAAIEELWDGLYLTAAWEDARNTAESQAIWRFTTEDARIKLK